MIPIRKLEGDNDIKLMAFYGRALYIGIISKPILSKRAILSGGPAYVVLHKVIINENVDRLNEIQSIIGTEDIASVDIYGDIDDCKYIINILEDYNRSIKRNQINLNNAFIFDDKNASGFTYTDLAEKFNNIIENKPEDVMLTDQGPIILNSEAEQKIAKLLIEEVDTSEKVEISDDEENDIYNILNRTYERKDRVTGKLKAVAIRSLNAAEESLHIYTTNKGIEISKFATMISYKEDYEAEAYLPAYYSITDLDVTRLKSYKISKYKIKELFKQYVKAYFDEWDKGTINEEYINDCLKSSDIMLIHYIIDNNTTFNMISEVLQYLFDKEIYISVNLRKSFDIVETYQKWFNVNAEVNETLSNNIEIDSFVTPNLMVDIDSEVEKAFEIIRKHAVKLAGKRN